MSRVGLGRHGQLNDEAGDPLDGLVNLFDLGIVLAVAFLIAGIALGAKSAAKTQPKPTAGQKTITTPKTKQTASGSVVRSGHDARFWINSPKRPRSPIAKSDSLS